MNWYVYSKLKRSEAGIMDTIRDYISKGVKITALVSMLMGLGYDEAKANEMIKQVGQQQSSSENQYTGEGAPEMIKRHEGYRDKAYKDTRGYRTIGYGYNLQKPGARKQISELGLDYDALVKGKISLGYDSSTGRTNPSLAKERAESLFQTSFLEAMSTAKSYVPDFSSLPVGIQVVLVDMSYNLGNKINKFVNMKDAIEKRDWLRMSREMKSSAWYGQVGNRSKELVGIVSKIK